jgi:GntR family transcriptional regulator/MocR family aminotransferase
LRTRRGPLFEAVPDGDAPRYRKVYRQIRDAILDRRLQAGERLPSTRTFASESAIARKTAEEAYAQLEAEGFIVRRGGSGSFVAETLIMPRSRGAVKLAGRRTLSKRGRAIAASTACVEPTTVRAFAAGLPALDAFPIELWQRIIARRARSMDARALAYGDPSGLPELREEIASYLAHARGVRCDASQVVIVSSSQQALDLIARLTIDPEDEAWIENPSYPGARAALAASGAALVPVRVDEEGLDVAHGIELAPRARLAYVTPSHQYPLGKTMSLERRLALLEWARRADAWVIEDDYDSEFRYDGRPVPSIQGLDSAGRVIYVGTFTKVLYPSLRLGYLVLPRDLAQSFVNARAQIDGHAPTFLQGVVAEFLREGHFGAHVRRMRALYRGRRDVFLDAAAKQLPMLTFPTLHAGLRATGFFNGDRADREASRAAFRAGLDAPALSTYYAGRGKSGLVLGYAGLTPDAIRRGVRDLGRVLSRRT